MTIEERDLFIKNVIQNGELYHEVIQALLPLETIQKVIIYEHYIKRMKWEKSGNYNEQYKSYSVRQKRNIANKGIDILYEKLKHLM